MQPGIKESISYLRKKIISWFNKNARDYPWRKTKDPFKILIAEIMLRRTRSDQVVPVYENFIEKFPDINSVAEAPEEYIADTVRPLGLRWRAPQFKMLARELKEKYNCSVPDERKDMESLTGVGEYVSGAVLSTAFGKKEWVVDVNIVRVFSRFLGIDITGEGRRDKRIIEISKLYVSCKKPAKAVMGILDFSALVCKTKKPVCKKCPVNKKCFYNNNNYQ